MNRTLVIGGAAIGSITLAAATYLLMPRGESRDARLVAADATRSALIDRSATAPPASAPPPVLTTPVPTEAVGTTANGFFDTGRTNVPAATMTPVPVATAEATDVVVSEEDEATPTVSENIDPVIAQTVLAAYLRYWNVRLHATDNPTADDLDFESVMAGDELGVAYKATADYAQRPVNQHTDLRHSLVVVSADATQATIEDQYTSTQNILDPDTGGILRGPYVETYREKFVLQPIGGVWKVTLHIAEDGQ